MERLNEELGLGLPLYALLGAYDAVGGVVEKSWVLKMRWGTRGEVEGHTRWDRGLSEEIEGPGDLRSGRCGAGHLHSPRFVPVPLRPLLLQQATYRTTTGYAPFSAPTILQFQHRTANRLHPILPNEPAVQLARYLHRVDIHNGALTIRPKRRVQQETAPESA